MSEMGPGAIVPTGAVLKGLAILILGVGACLGAGYLASKYGIINPQPGDNSPGAPDSKPSAKDQWIQELLNKGCVTGISTYGQAMNAVGNPFTMVDRQSGGLAVTIDGTGYEYAPTDPSDLYCPQGSVNTPSYKGRFAHNQEMNKDKNHTLLPRETGPAYESPRPRLRERPSVTRTIFKPGLQHNDRYGYIAQNRVHRNKVASALRQPGLSSVEQAYVTSDKNIFKSV